MHYPEALTSIAHYLPYTAFLISVFSALRLAKFNNDTRQTSSFVGLPVPANALFCIRDSNVLSQVQESFMERQ